MGLPDGKIVSVSRRHRRHESFPLPPLASVLSRGSWDGLKRAHSVPPLNTPPFLHRARLLPATRPLRRLFWTSARNALVHEITQASAQHLLCRCFSCQAELVPHFLALCISIPYLLFVTPYDFLLIVCTLVPSLLSVNAATARLCLGCCCLFSVRPVPAPVRLLQGAC